MTNTANLDKAIANHAKWKHHLRQAIQLGQSEWTAVDVARDDQCEFGLWLSSLPPSEQRSSHWQEVRELHVQFHAAAARVLELALSGAQDEAAKSLAMGSDFTNVSSKLVLAISAWKRDLAAEN